MMPLSEVVFLPGLAARVKKLSATVDGEVQAPPITLSTAALVGAPGLNPAQHELIRPVLPVEILSELRG